MISRQIPFFSNTSDNTHCYQATLKIILKYFNANEEYSWDELDKITAKGKDLWTWPTAGLLWLNRQGFEVRIIEGFSYEVFAKKGEKYLVKVFGEEVAKEQVKNSDIAQERKLAEELITRQLFEKRLPKFAEINQLLEEGYLIICNVNAKALNDEDGYVGHFVVVIGADNNELVIHDPGLPPQESRRVSREQFEKAWAYPNYRARNLIIIKK